MDDLTKGAADLVINHLLAEVEFFIVESLQCTLNRGCPTASLMVLAASFEAPFAIVWTTSAANFSGSSIGLQVWANTGACHASSATTSNDMV